MNCFCLHCASGQASPAGSGLSIFEVYFDACRTRCRIVQGFVTGGCVCVVFIRSLVGSSGAMRE